MKIDFVWDFKCNEVEARLIVDLVIGIVAFLTGTFFDPIASRFLIQHNQNFGAGQILWCAFWGIYLIWTMGQLRRWGE